MLPCDNGAKVAIGLTVFLSLYVLQLAIAENIPEADSLPLISKLLRIGVFYLSFKNTMNISLILGQLRGRSLQGNSSTLDACMKYIGLFS